MPMQKMEYEKVPEGTGKAEWSRRQRGGVDLWMTGEGGGCVAGAAHGGPGDWMGGRTSSPTAVRQSDVDGARVAARGQRWWGSHMTWLADQGEGVPVRRKWGAELPVGEKNTDTVRAHFTGATLAPAQTTQGQSGQEEVYMFR